jgi:hypothetical protein
MKKLFKIIGICIGSLIGAYAIYFAAVFCSGWYDYVARGDYALDQAAKEKRHAEFISAQASEAKQSHSAGHSNDQ